MIKYLFTNSDLIGSRAISGFTHYKFQKPSETPSHFAILYGSFVFHSNFADGVHIEPYYFFKKKNKTVRAFQKRGCKLSKIECELMFEQLIERAYGRKYDYWAVLYFAFRIILKRLFNKPIPDKNKWDVKNKWFCNELFEISLGQDLSMKTPNDLMYMLECSDDFDVVGVFE